MQQWDTHEIVLTAAQPYDNPYLEVDVTAVFDGSSGEHLTAMGFWDGGRTYRVRFTPTAAGRWHYTIDNNQGDPGLRARGTVEVAPAPPDAHGFVRRDVAYPISFVFDDGTRYFMWGTTYYGIANSACAGDRWIGAIDGARRYGINKVRMHVYPFDDMCSEQRTSGQERAGQPPVHPGKTSASDVGHRRRPGAWHLPGQAVRSTHRPVHYAWDNVRGCAVL
jgi:hypothetical protein